MKPKIKIVNKLPKKIAKAKAITEDILFDVEQYEPDKWLLFRHTLEHIISDFEKLYNYVEKERRNKK